MTNKPVGHDHGFKLVEFIACGALGFMPPDEQTMRLRFLSAAGEHLEETRPAQRSELTARISITEQLKWWLLAFGDGVEVLSPKQLRDEFRARPSVANHRYL